MTKEEFDKIYFETKEEKIQIYRDAMPDMLNNDEIIEYLDRICEFCHLDTACGIYSDEFAKKFPMHRYAPIQISARFQYIQKINCIKLQ